MKQQNKTISYKKVFLLVVFCIILYFFISICYVVPPQFMSDGIRIIGNEPSEKIIIKKDDPLFGKINQWLSGRRWCYPSFVSYCPYLFLGEESTERINHVVLWNDRVIFQYNNGLQLQYVSVFLTKDDKKIASEIKNRF
jgi:hypothetical protein